jgi:predicted Na+-dependent transporter
LFALKFVLKIEDNMIFGFLIALAMPTAGLSSTFSDQYDGDTENAVVFTLGATILSVLTIPILYGLLNLLLLH